MVSTKKLISDYLSKLTSSVQLSDLSFFTTSSISDKLYLSRSLTSGYLNELYEEGEAIKVSSRPVYYLNKSVVMEKFDTININSEYSSLTAFCEHIIDKTEPFECFTDIIGYQESVGFSIRQIKMSVNYPPRGLDILVSGEVGVGKKPLIDGAIQLAMKEKKIDRSKIFVCSITEKDEEIEKKLFGSANNLSIFEKLQNGVIVIQNVDKLSSSFQDTLANILRGDSFHADGKLIKLTSLVIMSTTDINAINKSLIEAIPLSCKLPSFAEKSLRDKMRTVLRVFYRELKDHFSNVEVSKYVLDRILNNYYPNNYIDINKLIKAICASVFTKYKGLDSIRIKTADLIVPPFNMIIDSNDNDFQEGYINLRNYFEFKQNSMLIDLFDEILYRFKQMKIKNDVVFFFDELFVKLKKHYDILISEKNVSDVKLQSISNSVYNISLIVKRSHGIIFSNNYTNLLSKIIYSDLMGNNQTEEWETERALEIDELYDYIFENYKSEYYIAKIMDSNFNTAFDFNLSKMNFIFLILNMKFYNKGVIKHYKTLGIIACHGNHTASSIADYVNSKLESNVLVGFDMSSDEDSNSISLKIDDYISENPYYQNIIVLVDMGSLEGIITQINNCSNLTIGLINNVTTSLALYVSNEIIHSTDIKDIIYKVESDYKIATRLRESKNKEKVIVVTSDSSIKVSNKIIKLLESSLPPKSEMKFLEYDYSEDKQKNFLKDMEQYEVILVVKPANINIQGFNSIALEDIVNCDEKGQEELTKLFSVFLDDKELDVFNQNLIKNFSLQNVMENLSILNPNKLIDLVYDAVFRIQRRLGLTISNKKLTGLYMHISLMIERLVTKNYIEVNQELVDRFCEERQDFIKVFNEGFETINHYYNIKIPAIEMILFYNYIVADSEKEGYY